MTENETVESPIEPDFLPLRLSDLFVRPSRLMDHVGKLPRWWIAGLLIMLINGVFITWTSPIILEEMRTTATHSRFEHLVSREQIQEQLDKTAASAEKNKLVSVLSNGLQNWALTIVFGLVLGFFIKMAGGQGSYPQALGVVHWAALIPYGLGTLIKLPLILYTGEFARITLSPAIFLSSESTGTFLYHFLADFAEVTQWWGLCVLVIGFERVFGLERGPAIISVVLPWALATGVMVGFRVVFGF